MESNTERSRSNLDRRDAVLALCVGLAFAGLAAETASRLGPGLTLPAADSVWFEADSPGYFAMMISRSADHLDTRTHPLFSLATWPSTVVSERLLGLSEFASASVTLALFAAVWGGAQFLLLRLLGGSRSGAVLFSAVALASATSRFWLGVPETYLVGSLGILSALIAAAVGAGVWGTTLASAATLAGTITNWTAGWAATLLRFPMRRAIQISANAFVLVTLLWGLEKALFFSAEYFLANWHEGAYILDDDALGPWAVVRSFFVHSGVAPRFLSVDRYEWSHLTLTVQGAGIAVDDALGALATTAWLALLIAGALRLIRAESLSTGRKVLLAALFLQLVFQLVFGEETFLYSPHWLPMLVAVGSLALETAWRRTMTAVALVFVIAGGLHNDRQFESAAREFAAYVRSLPANGPAEPHRVRRKHERVTEPPAKGARAGAAGEPRPPAD